MPEFAPRARETSRGRHPDLDENGDFLPDADLPANERDFHRMWANDSERAAFMRRVSIEQSQLPPDIQGMVAGQEYGSDPYSGYQEYRRDIERLRSPIGGTGRDLTGADVAKMDLATYDKFFDERGQPREGVTFYATGRDVDVLNKNGVDPFTQQELRRRPT